MSQPQPTPPIPWPFPVWDGKDFSCPKQPKAPKTKKPAYPDAEEAPF